MSEKIDYEKLYLEQLEKNKELKEENKELKEENKKTNERFNNLSNFMRKIHEDLLKKYRTIEENEMTDVLTKIGNRKYLMSMKEKIDTGMLVAEDYYFISMDVDNFKRVNDTLGHKGGDEALTSIAGIIKKRLKEECNQPDKNYIFRQSGDEFSALYFGKNEDEIIEILKNLQKDIISLGKSLYKNGGVDIDEYKNISLSMGIIHCSDFENMEEVIEKADDLMYYGKNSGKGQIKIYKNPDIQKRTLISNKE